MVASILRQQTRCRPLQALVIKPALQDIADCDYEDASPVAPIAGLAAIRAADGSEQHPQRSTI
ncbi:MAG: hypothetical protein IPO08_24860 [Xanthomonadales bacterium]|nr:hypothetical protein [Xanthomonadales bacterium]